jgi:hypothetical protein
MIPLMVGYEKKEEPRMYISVFLPALTAEEGSFHILGMRKITGGTGLVGKIIAWFWTCSV